jgi:hypothetical protein
MSKPSPVIFWLLLAATAAIHVVAMTWLAQGGTKSSASFLYDALISAELALVSLWAVFKVRTIWLAWVSAIVAVLISAVPSPWLEQLSFVESAAFNGGYVVILAATLWIIKRVSLWRRLTASSAMVWQFSVSHLLAAMTIIALLTVALRKSELLAEAPLLWKLLAVLTIGDVIVVTTTTCFWAVKRLWLLRLAAACSVAAIVGGVESYFFQYDATPVQLISYNATIAFILLVWLELVPIIPRGPQPADADAKHDSSLARQQ